MSLSDTPGTIRDIRTGRFGGKTVSLEASFVEQAKARSRVHPCYAVVGPDSSEEFIREVRSFCPVIVRESARGVVALVDGEPAEWVEGNGF